MWTDGRYVHMKTESTQAAADTWRSFVFPPSEGAVGFGFRDPGGVKAGGCQDKKQKEREKTKNKENRNEEEGGGNKDIEEEEGKRRRLTSTFIFHYITAFFENAPLRLTSVGKTPIRLFGMRETPSSCFFATTNPVLDSRGCTPNAAGDVRRLPRLVRVELHPASYFTL